MICKMCGAAGSVNVAEYELRKREPDNLWRLNLLQTAEALHEMCYDNKCSCQHKANVVVGIDWSRVKGEKDSATQD